MWFFMHFLGPTALDDKDGTPTIRPCGLLPDGHDSPSDLPIL